MIETDHTSSVESGRLIDWLALIACLVCCSVKIPVDGLVDLHSYRMSRHLCNLTVIWPGSRTRQSVDETLRRPPLSALRIKEWSAVLVVRNLWFAFRELKPLRSGTDRGGDSLYMGRARSTRETAVALVCSVLLDTY